ncbi:very-short-patch-repair endonuclease [Kribbella antiqua]|uniref:Very-short-patch-repair endonuclease n=1 Tax=Kribbella antiqua TaxID=2512217 RepID=A0A4R2IVD8_9ACTN|nr:type IV toxin-antitoxin system AbiEi family antitoxin domain-containing protein [Kribbella antiqua]TCO48652.1 very-short-patch-repair endonuclease [Kribbella antiqua]
MESVHEVLARQGGWATYAELVAATSRRAVAVALERGEIQRIAQGIYAVPGLPADTVATLAYDGVLSHVSAAAALKLPLLVAPEKPHVTLPPKRRPRPGPSAVLHWADTDSDERRNRITSLLRTVLDCSRVLPFGEALAVADAALATGNLSQEQLLAATAAMRGPGCPDARRMAAAATRESGSFLESMLRALLISEGIDGFEPQVLVTNGWFRARVDLGHRRARLALEADGFEFHGSRQDFAADCHRYDELVAAGWLVLRLTYEQVIGDPAWVVATIRATLAQRLAG